MTWKGSLKGLSRILRRSRLLQAVSMVVALVGFAGGLATLWPYLDEWFEPTEFRVHVLHPSAAEADGVWTDFDEGLDQFLDAWRGRLDGPPMVIRDRYELSFQRKTWHAGDEEELLQAVAAVLEDDRTLAIVAATNTADSELILRKLQEEDEPPILLLAMATKNGLLRRIDDEGAVVPLRGVFRMVPKNQKQAERLARTIVSSHRPPCSEPRQGSISVAILREEGQNAGFSRDLAEALRRDLEGPQHVTLLVDSVADSLVTVPRELVELEADFLVYIGSQSGAARLYAQMKRLGERVDEDPCLPRLLLPDAGLLGDRHRYYQGLVPESVAALPLSSEAGERANFGSLGADSAMLLLKAVADSDPTQKMSRAVLGTSLDGLEVEGRAHYYKFQDGENERADFHLWSVSGDTWKHHPDCNSDYHHKEDILAVESRAPAKPRLEDPRRASTVRLRIGGKPFPEQSLLAAMAVHLLEDAGIPASLGQVSLNGVWDLLLLGRIDAYWEYTGTALHRYHGRKELRGEEALATLRDLDASRVVWTDPLPIDNTYLLLARPELAQEHDIHTLSDLADHVAEGGQVRLCANSEWFSLEDGLAGLQEAYGFEWPPQLLVEKPLALIYEDADQCELLLGYATDPEVLANGLRPLRDDRGFFPEYLPAFVLREDVQRHLEEEQPAAWSRVEKRLACLAEHLDSRAMRGLLVRLQQTKMDADAVAGEFLDERCPVQQLGNVIARL